MIHDRTIVLDHPGWIQKQILERLQSVAISNLPHI